jgi:GNAT superfamily N-acetyltransferase
MRTVICPTQLHFHELASHFLGLSRGDRFLRFGWTITDVGIVAYVESLFASSDNVFVVVEPRRDISGALHLEPMGCGVSLGLSVSARARNLGIGTLLLQRAGRLASARGLKTLFVRNLNLNAGLQRLALRLGMRVACAPHALTASSEMAAANGHDARRDEFAGKITLADDLLRSQWNGCSPDVALLDLPEPVFS